MLFEQTSYLGDVQILKRKPFEAIPLTLDFTNVVDKLNGKKVQYVSNNVENRISRIQNNLNTGKKCCQK